MYPTNNLWIQATPEVAKKIFLIRSRVLYLHFWRIHDNFFWMGSATTSEKCIRCYSFYVVTTWTQMCKNWVRDSTVCPPRRQAVNYWAKNYLLRPDFWNLEHLIREQGGMYDNLEIFITPISFMEINVFSIQ